MASTWEPSRLIFYFNVLSLTGVARMVSIVRASNEHLPQCDHLIDPACRATSDMELEYAVSRATLTRGIIELSTPLF